MKQNIAKYDSKAFKILMIDNDALYCISLQKFFQLHPSIAIVGFLNHHEIGSKQNLDAFDFDFVLLDMHMPNQAGIEIMRQLGLWKINKPIIACSPYLHQEYTLQFSQLGFSFWLTKENPETMGIKLLNYFNRINDSETNSNSVNHKAIETTLNTVKIGGADNPINISNKELELIILICQEKNTKEIGESICLSAEAIKKQKAKLAFKLGITNSSLSFLKYAMQHKLIDMKE